MNQAPYMEQCINIMPYIRCSSIPEKFAAALQQSFHEYSLFKSITIKGVVMFQQCLPQYLRKIYEYSLGVMMCAKASREAVNGKCTSPEAHLRHIMHKLFCSNLIAILICMVKSRYSLAVKFAVNLQQPYGSYTAVCAGDLFFFIRVCWSWSTIVSQTWILHADILQICCV